MEKKRQRGEEVKYNKILGKFLEILSSQLFVNIFPEWLNNYLDKKVKSLSRISRMPPEKLKKNKGILKHFKRLVKYKDVNDSQYESDHKGDDPISVRNRLSEVNMFVKKF